MPAIILGAYGLVGIVHELAGLRFWELTRKITKGLLLPVLLVYYVVAAHQFLWTALVAITLSWLGDLFLIRKDEPRFFRLGMVAFLLSHVFYLVALVVMTSGVHVPALIASICVALAAEFFLPRLINPPKEMRAAIVVYEVVILAMSVGALQYMVSNPTVGSVLLFIGSIVFIFSDVLMTYLAFGTKPKYFNAVTMLPYIVAQGLIVYGLAG